MMSIRNALLGRLTTLFRQLRSQLQPFVQQTSVIEVRREHLKLLALTIRLFAIVGISSIILLAIDFRSGLNGVGALACGAIPVLYVLIVLQEIRWRRGGEDRVFLRRSLAILAAQGVCWGVLINSALTVANGSQRSLLAAIVIALISTPLVASPLSAAIAFWLPSAISGVIFISRVEMFDPYLMLCFLGYANFTVAAMVISNRFMLERSIGRISLERQNETIALFLQDYVDNGSDWLWEIDADLTLRHVSPRLAEVARQPAHELEGMPLVDLLHVDDDEAGNVPLVRLLKDRAPFRNLTLTVRVGSEVRWWTITGRPVTGPGGCFQGYRGIGSDITEARRAEDRVRYLASHDSLTGLANRQLFRDCLALAQSGGDGTVPGSQRPESPQQRCVVLLLDLDRFKSVNDSFGHAVGDELLIAVAERLRRCVREGSVVARLGGDEFGILTTVQDAPEAAAIAQRIVETLSRDYALAGGRQTIGASVGISFVGPDDQTPVDCMRRADLALYAAKAAGRGVHRIYADDMINDQHDRLTLQADLRFAIANDGLTIRYQPIFDIRDGRIKSVEALCRWNHPTLGAIPPSRFIPLAEETGLIAELGDWILAHACDAAAGWPCGVRISINISPLEIKGGDFAVRLDRVLKDTGLPPERLELELTEHSYLDAARDSLETLQGLRDKGIRLILDDFGTGYSSLSYLTSFMCDGIKIDASFIRDLEDNPAKAAVVRAIAQLATDLSIPVTAEGVEKRPQRELLRKYHINFAQGFFLQVPVDQVTILDILERDAVRLPEVAVLGESD
ncbi:MAG: hypothetical protein B7Z80_21895 [Rhodospirillales bacterium 20-64-7]|nr:MAG: hypothetical protein B7Z80_21895 [Rhodospirillales bacterium 20-64-7]